MADYDAESDLSGDEEMIDNVGNFDLVNIQGAERQRLEEAWRNLAGDSEDDDEFEGFEDVEAYRTPEFLDWAKTENQRDFHQFSEHCGPTRVLDGSGTALDYFQLFYSDQLFSEIVRLTNLNAETKRNANPAQHKGVWSDVTVPEMKAYYGLLLLMEVMKFDRDELYWSQSGNYWTITSKFGDVMPREIFVSDYY